MQQPPPTCRLLPTRAKPKKSWVQNQTLVADERGAESKHATARPGTLGLQSTNLSLTACQNSPSHRKIESWTEGAQRWREKEMLTINRIWGTYTVTSARRKHSLALPNLIRDIGTLVSMLGGRARSQVPTMGFDDVVMKANLCLEPGERGVGCLVEMSSVACLSSNMLVGQTRPDYFTEILTLTPLQHLPEPLDEVSGRPLSQAEVNSWCVFPVLLRAVYACGCALSVCLLPSFLEIRFRTSLEEYHCHGFRLLSKIVDPDRHCVNNGSPAVRNTLVSVLTGFAGPSVDTRFEQRRVMLGVYRTNLSRSRLLAWCLENVAMLCREELSYHYLSVHSAFSDIGI